MNKKSYIWLGLLVLVAVCMVGGALIYFQTRVRAFNSRPLVLIHNPINHAQFQAGDGVLVHATIRAKNGIARAELWADEVLMATRTITDGSAPTSLVFSESWIASTTGNHVLIVRAFAVDETVGQASIVLEVIESEDANADTPAVQGDETAESIASNNGTTPEESAASNSGSGTDGDNGASAAHGDAPAPEGTAPDSSAVDFRFLGIWDAFNSQDNTPTGLRVELLSLQTGASFEGLHCYVGFGGASPSWYPDSDDNQSTDESFSQSSSGEAGDWEVQEHFAEDDAPIIFWPQTEPISLSVSCVGIAAGGTDALELGRWEESVPPEQWTGMVLSESTSGADGSFDFTFRITHVNMMPIYLDITMTPPTNARIIENLSSLRWAYAPDENEEPIDGFRIYLNGNLQWTEPADSHESGLPYEWLHPPCGSTYTFDVTAYRIGLPDGPESSPATVEISQPAEGCQREVQITFITLETFDLGSDGNYEKRDGDVGPAYGYFYANEQQITFDGGSGLGNFDSLGLRHNETYDLMSMAALYPYWQFSSRPPFLVMNIPVSGSLELGWRIMNRNSGRCDDSDDPGCDRLICEGSSGIYDEDDYNDYFDRQNEIAWTSEDGRCRVTIFWGPTANSPVGSGVPGWEPLPWIDIEELEIDKTTGQVRIHIRNSGTATWPQRDLKVDLRSRDGTSLGLYTWPVFALEAGQRTVLEDPGMRLDAPYDGCVFIDPYNEVLELYERTEMYFHGPTCPQLPDLTIRNVQFDDATGHLEVTVQNIGTGEVEDQPLSLEVLLPDESSAYLSRTVERHTMVPNQISFIDIPGVTESVRNRLANGYSVFVNRNGTIPEADPENNSFSINPYHFRMWADCSAYVPHYHGLGSTARVFTTAEILSETASRTVLEVTRTNTLTSTETFSYGYDHFWNLGNMGINSCSDDSQTFDMMSNESLRVTIHADFLAGSDGDREYTGGDFVIYDADQYSDFPFQTGTWYDTYCPLYASAPLLGTLPISGTISELWFAYFCIAQITP